jgi:hypothetical protein
MDYIAKMNQNVSTLTEAINQLQTQAGAAAGAGSAMSTGMFMNALFNGADALIGPGSYVPSQSGSTLTVSAGAMYLAAPQAVASSPLIVTISFLGQTAGTHYIVVDSTGTVSRQGSRVAGTAYSVYWSGASFNGQPIRLAPCFYDTAEATASRMSTALGELESPAEVVEFDTLDQRLEATETAAGPERKIGCTVDGTVGVKGAIQIDFDGDILGWTIIADRVGSLAVSVSRKASSAPPAAPGIPSPTTDKISGSSPIQLTTAQSAAWGNMSGWTTTLSKWDVVQFTVESVTTITRATLYLRIGAT